MQENIEQLEKEIAALKERNRRVEGEKAWETSWTRMLSIALATYVIAVVVLDAIGIASPVFAAFLPAIGYMLSTLSLPALKKWWIGKFLH